MAEFPTNGPNNVVDASDLFARHKKQAEVAQGPEPVVDPETISLEPLEALTPEQINTLMVLYGGLSSPDADIRDRYAARINIVVDNGKLPPIVAALCTAVQYSTEVSIEGPVKKP